MTQINVVVRGKGHAVKMNASGANCSGMAGSETQPVLNRKPFENRRLNREWTTLRAMVLCYCQDLHHTLGKALCPDCEALLSYASVRLDRCRFGEMKPTCAKCPVHCYAPDRREQVRTVMRYAGPRMLWRHPILCLFHWLDSFRRAPEMGLKT